jgi:hypothetical protein
MLQVVPKPLAFLKGVIGKLPETVFRLKLGVGLTDPALASRFSAPFKLS